MEHPTVQLTFSVMTKEHIKWRDKYQVQIAMRQSEAPHILRGNDEYPPLYAIAMGNEELGKVAIELSLEALDMFATGPTDISVHKDSEYIYVVVRDIAPLIPVAWQTSEPKSVVGEIKDCTRSFLISFDV